MHVIEQIQLAVRNALDLSDHFEPRPNIVYLGETEYTHVRLGMVEQPAELQYVFGLKIVRTGKPSTLQVAYVEGVQ